VEAALSAEESMKRIPLKVMMNWCRALGMPLRAGLTAKEAFRLAAKKADPTVQDLCQRVSARLDDGDDLPTAFKSLPYRIPPLFHAMAAVGNKTGRFPEILRDLEEYYRFQLQLKREFLQRIAWPVIQLIAAICVVALMIFLMGTLAAGPSGKPAFDPLGFGLYGASGAMIWLAGWAFFAAGLFFTYKLSREAWGMGGKVDSLLLRVPALGPCLHTLAMARLCMAMGMTMDSPLSVRKTVPLSLDATDNGAFIATAKPIVESVHDRGRDLAEAFAEHRLYPDEFLHVLGTAEQSGSVPEEMTRLGNAYNEQAKHKLAILNQALGWVVWGTVAAMIIFLIFRMALKYIGMLNQAAQDPMAF
jgi:type IV pilus assembly protein PilC